jgi:hypothetical protein
MSERKRLRAGRILDAEFQIVDRQVIDSDGVPVVAVDDLELSDVPWGAEIPPGTEAPVVESLLSGPVLGTRLFGGRPPEARWQRIAWSHITEIDTAITLDAPGAEFDATWTERWVRDHVIGPIPGGRHDPE